MPDPSAEQNRDGRPLAALAVILSLFLVSLCTVATGSQLALRTPAVIFLPLELSSSSSIDELAGLIDTLQPLTEDIQLAILEDRFLEEAFLQLRPPENPSPLPSPTDTPFISTPAPVPPQPSATATSTPTRDHGPPPTKTPKPTRTPRPTRTPKATDTPTATGTAEATPTPQTNASPTPTLTQTQDGDAAFAAIKFLLRSDDTHPFLIPLFKEKYPWWPT